eukprot:CAMPEP_0117660082 /NCGR_PEP_ID=MMETSP0804-20121206/6777_1 /TAXON_ID=1074897 /ORGANISM="Tetraselmis astigmatica, Strain CCMP880" /LENGTH=553 /DNA_ID=CAMNT_0005466785 /DNA_START=100 /DNA_END=1761 /DNA_ORIENTATION=+
MDPRQLDSLASMAASALLLLLLAVPRLALGDARARHDFSYRPEQALFVPPPGPSQPEVKIWVYPLDSAKWDRHCWQTAFCDQLLRRMYISGHITEDPEQADYYYIPHPLPFERNGAANTTILLQLFKEIWTRWPYFNQTVAAGEARHIMLLVCDHGPGDCSWQRPIDALAGTSGGIPIPPSINPAHRDRVLLFLTNNAFMDGADATPPQETCISCFQRGKDIALVTHERSVCGPWCGRPRQQAKEDLEENSPWNKPDVHEAPYRYFRDRNVTLFYGGTILAKNNTNDYTARGGLYHYHKRTPGFLVINTLEEEGVPFSRTMRFSKFCYVPRGQHGGDRDRYVPAILHGCVPVMSGGTKATPIAAPFEEHPDICWPDFSVEVLIGDQMKHLDRRLESIDAHHRANMHHALGRVWPRFLWSSVFNHTYLGEDGTMDSFQTLMDILMLRRRQPGANSVGHRFVPYHHRHTSPAGAHCNNHSKHAPPPEVVAVAGSDASKRLNNGKHGNVATTGGGKMIKGGEPHLLRKAAHGKDSKHKRQDHKGSSGKPHGHHSTK